MRIPETSLPCNNLEADGEAQHFRYKISQKTKCSVLVPKALAPDVDMTALRSTMFGAAYGGNFNKVPQNGKAVRVLWEVTMERSVPAVVMHKKPKAWLLCKCTLRPGCAHKITT